MENKGFWGGLTAVVTALLTLLFAWRNDNFTLEGAVAQATALIAGLSVMFTTWPPSRGGERGFAGLGVLLLSVLGGAAFFVGLLMSGCGTFGKGGTWVTDEQGRDVYEYTTDGEVWVDVERGPPCVMTVVADEDPVCRVRQPKLECIVDIEPVAEPEPETPGPTS